MSTTWINSNLLGAFLDTHGGETFLKCRVYPGNIVEAKKIFSVVDGPEQTDEFFDTEGDFQHAKLGEYLRRRYPSNTVVKQRTVDTGRISHCYTEDVHDLDLASTPLFLSISFQRFKSPELPQVYLDVVSGKFPFAVISISKSLGSSDQVTTEVENEILGLMETINEKLGRRCLHATCCPVYTKFMFLLRCENMDVFEDFFQDADKSHEIIHGFFKNNMTSKRDKWLKDYMWDLTKPWELSVMFLQSDSVHLTDAAYICELQRQRESFLSTNSYIDPFLECSY